MIATFTVALRSMAVAGLSAVTLASAGPASAAPPSGSGGSPGVQQLLSQLSGGYTPADCQQVPTAGRQIAKITCGQNHDQGGPASTDYILYPNTTTMNADYQATLNANTVNPFPDGSDSPGDWYYNQSKDQVAGSDAMITLSDGLTNMLWTNNSRRRIAVAVPAGSPADLQNWWYREG
jgi:hypothetical protein